MRILLRFRVIAVSYLELRTWGSAGHSSMSLAGVQNRALHMSRPHAFGGRPVHATDRTISKVLSLEDPSETSGNHAEVHNDEDL
jgi:hypothetical protein